MNRVNLEKNYVSFMKTYNTFKRTFDIFFSIGLIFLLLPIFVIISALIYLNMGNPILFVQERPGYKEKIFKFYKFRTMKNLVADEKDEDRITKVGRFLRQTSLDEIPSFFNVIKGEMSMVGPRPLLKEYLPLYSKKHSLRHTVKPGITGWAQINGRNGIDWNKKLDFDIWYIKNNSFWLDLKILLMTLIKVIMQEGISQKDHVTMEKFKG